MKERIDEGRLAHSGLSRYAHKLTISGEGRGKRFVETLHLAITFEQQGTPGRDRR